MAEQVRIAVVGGGVDPANSQTLAGGGKVITRTTSGAYGHTLAMATVPNEYATPDTMLSMDILDERYDAVVIPDSLHDPENLRPRM